jgi:hypothetical protein
VLKLRRDHAAVRAGQSGHPVLQCARLGESCRFRGKPSRAGDFVEYGPCARSAFWRFYAIVFVFATVANQAIFSAGLIWISTNALDQHRATLLGFGALLIAIASSLLGAALGALAQNSAIIGPLLALLTLNLLAAGGAVLLAPRRHQRTPPDG